MLRLVNLVMTSNTKLLFITYCVYHFICISKSVDVTFFFIFVQWFKLKSRRSVCMWNSIVQKHKCVLFFFITSKLVGVPNALLMSWHGGIYDLRASKWSMTYGKGFWVKQTQSQSHLVLSDQSLSVRLESYMAETAVQTERWFGEQGDGISWRIEKTRCYCTKETGTVSSVRKQRKKSRSVGSEGD